MPGREWQQLSLHFSPEQALGHMAEEAAKDQEEPFLGISARPCPSTGLEKRRAEMDNELRLILPNAGRGLASSLRPAQGNAVTWVTASGKLHVVDSQLSPCPDVPTHSLSQGGGRGCRDT